MRENPPNGDASLAGWRVGFAGTPEFAAEALRALLAAGATVPIVLTQPDRPAGRGLKLQPSPVKALALEHGLPVHQPRSLKLDGRYPEDAAAAQQVLQQADLDVLVVAAYGLILPRWTLDVPRQGCLNIHASILPRWRGAAPIHRALEAGDRETGITLMQMDEGLDTGDMRLVAVEPIHPDDTTASLHDRLAALGGRLVVQGLAQLRRSELPRTPQPAEGICYAHKIEKAEAAIDWSQPAAVIERRLRAFDPFPGATFRTGSSEDAETVKLWRAAVEPGQPADPAPAPGTVLQADAHRVVVACGEGALSLLSLQRPGGKRLAVAAFQASAGLNAGQRLA